MTESLSPVGRSLVKDKYNGVLDGRDGLVQELLLEPELQVENHVDDRVEVVVHLLDGQEVQLEFLYEESHLLLDVLAQLLLPQFLHGLF